jgi:hypothetical protein
MMDDECAESLFKHGIKSLNLLRMVDERAEKDFLWDRGSLGFDSTHAFRLMEGRAECWVGKGTL